VLVLGEYGDRILERTKMIRAFALTAISVGVLSACSPHPAHSAPRSTERMIVLPATNAAPRSASILTPSAPNYASAREAVAGACVEFATLLSDFASVPPSQDALRLQQAGAKILISADESTRLGGGAAAEKLNRDATSLMKYLSQPDFAQDGNVAAPQIKAMQDDCP
jgi:hypothetical protein